MLRSFDLIFSFVSFFSLLHLSISKPPSWKRRADKLVRIGKKMNYNNILLTTFYFLKVLFHCFCLYWKLDCNFLTPLWCGKNLELHLWPIWPHPVLLNIIKCHNVIKCIQKVFTALHIMLFSQPNLKLVLIDLFPQNWTHNTPWWQPKKEIVIFFFFLWIYLKLKNTKQLNGH